jgi:hypothetical protein
MEKAMMDLMYEYWREWLDMWGIVPLRKPLSSIMDVWPL